MVRWRYEVFVWGPGHTWYGLHGDAGVDAMLAQKGEEGWELVTIVSDDSGIRFFFKQPG